MPGNTSTFPLLSLPCELRLQIYENLLVTPEPVGPFCHCRYWRKQALWGRPLEPQILRVCRRVHDEAADVLYKQNAFRLEEQDHDDGCVDSIDRFLTGIGHNAALIRTVCSTNWVPYTEQDFTPDWRYGQRAWDSMMTSKEAIGCIAQHCPNVTRGELVGVKPGWWGPNDQVRDCIGHVDEWFRRLPRMRKITAQVYVRRGDAPLSAEVAGMMRGKGWTIRFRGVKNPSPESWWDLRADEGEDWREDGCWVVPDEPVDLGEWWDLFERGLEDGDAASSGTSQTPVVRFSECVE